MERGDSGIIAGAMIPAHIHRSNVKTDKVAVMDGATKEARSSVEFVSPHYLVEGGAFAEDRLAVARGGLVREPICREPVVADGLQGSFEIIDVIASETLAPRQQIDLVIYGNPLLGVFRVSPSGYKKSWSCASKRGFPALATHIVPSSQYRVKARRLEGCRYFA